MTADKKQPIDNQSVSPSQRVLKVAPHVYYGRPNPQLMRIHADDVQGTLPNGESPEEHGGELVGYCPLPVPNRKPHTGRRVVEVLVYLALAIAANPFVYFLLPSYSLSEETLGSLYLAGIGFSVLSIGILPLVLLVFSLGAVINFLAVMVNSIWRRGAEERFTFRLVYDCAPPSKTNQERYASRHRSGITQPVTSFGGSSDSSQKGEAKLLFFAVSVLNPYIAAGILSITGLFGAGPLVAALFMMVNQVSAGLMGIPGIIWFVAWILSIVRLNEAAEA
ncbi:type VI secretion protein [Rothia sp. HMSC069C04]|jgi:type IV secretory pathway, virD4 component|uniref:type VI secretion protein n=1 Tax=Rothia sp. HMSC069C04 TaxID=1739383 RepID=UPI0008A4615B|nr:type VI secretion protein [Rothia sp. HMSC069C04]OFR65470.1 type VI secretion protein [Rothia sp. HMSC069C04]